MQNSAEDKKEEKQWHIDLTKVRHKNPGSAHITNPCAQQIVLVGSIKSIEIFFSGFIWCIKLCHS